jgi:rhamnose transport system substrate-binding protein
MRKLLFSVVVILIVVSVVAAFSLSGCKVEEPTEEAVEEKVEEPTEEAEEEAATIKEGPFTMAFLAKGLGAAYFDSCADGAFKAADELGDELLYLGPEDWSVENQIVIVESLIDQEVDVIGIAANGKDSLAPVCKKALDAGIHVMSWDAPVAPEARESFLNQVSFEEFGRGMIKEMAKAIDYKGDIAILSATPQAPNQREWVNWIYEEIKDEKYKDMEIVDVVFGDDLPEKSYDKALGLIKAYYPDLKGIIAPTSVALPAACAAVEDKGLIGEIKVTGGTVPSAMLDYVKNGTCDSFVLWSTIDLGYVSTYMMHYLCTGEFTGAVGETFTTGNPDLGEFEVVTDEDGNPFVLLGPPLIFDINNIEYWAEIF